MSHGARADELYAALAQQAGGIEPLLESFFGFLHRQTDFYVVAHDPAARRIGFAPGVAQQKVLEAFQKYPLKHVDAAPAETNKALPPSARVKAKAGYESAAASAAATVRMTESGKQLPDGNGGRTDRYTWTQTLEELTIHLPLPASTRAKDVDCQLRADHVRVALRHRVGDPDPVVLVDGDLPERIRADESFWSVESDPATLLLSLEKIKPTWWASAVVGDAEIDTSQVDSTRAIGEYDETTQGAIRKALFNQQQRQHGLPTTDEMQTEHILAAARNLPDAPPI